MLMNLHLSFPVSVLFQGATVLFLNATDLDRSREYGQESIIYSLEGSSHFRINARSGELTHTIFLFLPLFTCLPPSNNFLMVYTFNIFFFLPSFFPCHYLPPLLSYFSISLLVLPNMYFVREAQPKELPRMPSPQAKATSTSSVWCPDPVFFFLRTEGIVTSETKAQRQNGSLMLALLNN